jgi:hypothetical protein
VARRRLSPCLDRQPSALPFECTSAPRTPSSFIHAAEYSRASGGGRERGGVGRERAPVIEPLPVQMGEAHAAHDSRPKSATAS